MDTGAGLPQGDFTIPYITGRFTMSCIVQFIHTQRETTKRNYYAAGRYVLTPRPYKPSTKKGSQRNSTLLSEVSRPTSFKNYKKTHLLQRGTGTIYRRQEAVEDFGLPREHAEGSSLSLWVNTTAGGRTTQQQQH